MAVYKDFTALEIYQKEAPLYFPDFSQMQLTRQMLDAAAGVFSLVDRKNKFSASYFQHVHETGYAFQRRLGNA